MRNRSKASVLALCGILAALAVALMFLGGVIPFAAIACPVLASLVLIPVYAETGKKWSLLWYAAVAILGLLLAPDKEAAILFAFFGYYPMLKKLFSRLPTAWLKWLVKFAYVNAAIFAAYSLMIFVFRMDAVSAEFAQMERYLLIVLLLLSNLSFLLYDILIDRLEILYHVRIRPKLKL